MIECEFNITFLSGCLLGMFFGACVCYMKMNDKRGKYKDDFFSGTCICGTDINHEEDV